MDGYKLAHEVGFCWEPRPSPCRYLPGIYRRVSIRLYLPCCCSLLTCAAPKNAPELSSDFSPCISWRRPSDRFNFSPVFKLLPKASAPVGSITDLLRWFLSRR